MGNGYIAIPELLFLLQRLDSTGLYFYNARYYNSDAYKLGAILKNKYACPCCGYLTLEESPPGTFDICPVCFWEDDDYQLRNPIKSGGANHISLNNAKTNFKSFGAIDGHALKFVRKPRKSEIPP